MAFRMWDAESGEFVDREDCDRCVCVFGDMCTHGCYPDYHYADTLQRRPHTTPTQTPTNDNATDNTTTDDTSHDTSTFDTTSADTQSNDASNDSATLHSASLPFPITETRAVTDV